MSFIGKKIHRLLHRPTNRKKRRSDTISFDTAKIIGVLFTYIDQRRLNEVNSFVQTLYQLKDVKVLCFNNSKAELSTDHPTVNLNELSNLGKLNSPAASYFITTPLDFLFHLDFELNEITQSILAKSNAKCRLGVYSEAGQDYYEMMVNMNKSAGIVNLGEQLLKYAKRVK